MDYVSSQVGSQHVLNTLCSSARRIFLRIPPLKSARFKKTPVHPHCLLALKGKHWFSMLKNLEFGLFKVTNPSFTPWLALV